jgi:hypothetical protein
MFGKRTQDLDSMARAAWHDVVDTLSSSEAGRRAGSAWDALAGRQPTRTWPMLRAAAIGVLIGWVGAEVYRRRRPQIDAAVDRVGEELRDAKTTVDERLARAKATPGTPMDKAKAAMSPPANAQPSMGSTGTTYGGTTYGS